MAIAKARKATGTGEPMVAPTLEAGSYYARVVSIVDLGLQPGSRMYPEPKHKLKFVFECMDEFMYKKEDDGSYDEEAPLIDKPRWFSYEVTYSPDGYVGTKANLYPLLQILSPSFKATEVMEEDYSDLIGRPICIILSTYVKSKGKRKGEEDNKITGFSAMTKKQFMALKAMKEQGVAANLELVGEGLYFDWDCGLDAWNRLNKGNQYADQDRIRASTMFPGSALESVVGVQAQAAPVEEAEEESVSPEALAEQEAKLEAEAQAKARAEAASRIKTSVKEAKDEVAQTEEEFDDIF